MALGAIFFFRGVIFGRKHGSYRNLFFRDGFVLYFFLGLIIECVIRTPKMNHVFIYIYRSCFLED